MKRFLQKLFFKTEKHTPPMPTDWHLTMADLIQEMKEGKRSRIGQPERDWAHAYEKSLIPADYRFPQQGDMYESKMDQDIDFVTSWQSPYTGGGTTKLFKGERIWISSTPAGDTPVGTYVLPVDYKKLEQRIVPQTDRDEKNYNGFQLVVTTKVLHENFTLIQTGFHKELYT